MTDTTNRYRWHREANDDEDSRQVLRDHATGRSVGSVWRGSFWRAEVGTEERFFGWQRDAKAWVLYQARMGHGAS